MPFYRGDEGSLHFTNTSTSPSIVTALRNWSFTLEKEEIEATAQGDTFKTFLPGLVSGSGTAEMLFDKGTGTKQELLEDIVSTDAVANAKFKLFFNGSEDITFDGMVTSAEYGATVGEVESVTVSFRATGTITLNVT